MPGKINTCEKGAIRTLQKSIDLIPLLPRAGPTGGLGLACPAPTMSLTIWSTAAPPRALDILGSRVVDQRDNNVSANGLKAQCKDKAEAGGPRDRASRLIAENFKAARGRPKLNHRGPWCLPSLPADVTGKDPLKLKGTPPVIFVQLSHDYPPKQGQL